MHWNSVFCRGEMFKPFYLHLEVNYFVHAFEIVKLNWTILLMNRKKIFNDLVKYFSALYPHLNGKQRKVAEEWKLSKDIKMKTSFLTQLPRWRKIDFQFLNAVAKMKKDWKDHCMAERNSKLVFANVKQKAPRVEIYWTSSIESDSDLCGSCCSTGGRKRHHHQVSRCQNQNKKS